MGPSALVAEDLDAGRLVAPFPDIALPARSYCWYLPEEKAADPVVDAFCQFLAQISNPSGLRPGAGERPKDLPPVEHDRENRR